MSRGTTKYLTLIVFAFLITSGVSVVEALSAGYSFTRTLKMGISGEDVRELQRQLNLDPETRISGSGPGSPGQETPYFGALTRDAVVRFQEKHGAGVLIPAGLSAGTGIVGPYTISALATIQGIIPAPVASPVAPTNPNLNNLDKFLSAVEDVSTRQGLPASETSIIKDQIVKDAATTTDLMAAFVKIVEEKNKQLQSSKDVDLFGRFTAKVALRMAEVFAPKEAIAQTSTAFGGRLLYSYFCTCSFTWLLLLTPLPPSYATLLTYTPLSQAYLTYNIPYTTNLLGKYSSGGQCSTYVGVSCIAIPSQGRITPTVGSSAR